MKLTIEEIKEHMTKGNGETNILSLSYYDIDELPEGLEVDSLEINDTGIIKLPEDLIVKRYLDISFTRISELPKGCLDIIDLYAEQSGITTVPSMKNIKYLNLSRTDINELPEGLNLIELDVSYTNIDKLPEDLIVSDNLTIPKNIKIPEGCKLCKKIYRV